MSIYELAALTAASCWAFAGLISSQPAQHLGAFTFNQIRLGSVFVILLTATIFSGSYTTFNPAHLLPILLSGFIGFFLGDTALFQCMNRLGPRRMAILFATNAPMATLLGWVFLDEQLSLTALIGILLIISGVILAIAFGKKRSQLNRWEKINGPLWIGVTFGLLAALAQALGSLIARPVMADGADPVLVSALRMGIATLAMSLLCLLPYQQFKPVNPINLKIVAQTAFSGFIAIGIGVTLLMFALSGGEVGIISTLSATAPAIMLPLLWIKTGEAPVPAAWLGALLAVIGSGFLFMT